MVEEKIYSSAASLHSLHRLSEQKQEACPSAVICYSCTAFQNSGSVDILGVPDHI